MKITIENMPLDTVYQYGKDCYIWKTKRTSTRGGNYSSSEEHVYTEVFDTRKDGTIYCSCSGNLVTNPGIYKNDGLNDKGCFAIFDYDQDCMYSFAQTMPLALANPSIAKNISDKATNAKSFKR